MAVLGRSRVQGFVLFVVGTELVAQTAVIWFSWYEPALFATPFLGEVRTLAAFGAALSVAAWIAPTRRAFWAVSALRLVLSLALVGLTLRGAGATHVLILLPALFEVATYERRRFATISTIGIGAAYLVAMVAGRPDTLLPDAAIGLAGMACPAALLGILMHYRETLVERSRRIVGLERAFEQLTDSNLGLQLYASNAGDVSAQKERTRITRELHDSVGYALTNIIMMLKAARVLQRSDPERLDGLLKDAQDMSITALDEARRTLYRLRKVTDAERQGLWAIGRLVKAYRLATGVDVEIEFGNVEWSLGSKIDAAFYRVVQEGLTNAYRHGGASKVLITLWMTDHEVVLNVWDNGNGAAVVNEGIGLSGMRERIGELNGTVGFANMPIGFQISVRVPWKADADGQVG